jgi:membrane protein implicated in regulation of membrane protease activity
VDIRLPVGAIFTIYGVLLTVYGLTAGDVEVRHMLLGLQVNIVAGVGMLIFGVSFLYLARKGTRTVRSSSSSAEGRAIEDRERRTGLEGH